MAIKSSKAVFLIIITLLAVLVVVGIIYWFLFMHTPTPTGVAENPSSQTGFQPINRALPIGSTGQTGLNGSANGSSTISMSSANLPTLRLLSNTPVGGYGATTTASTTIVRWIDRGRGNVYQAWENSSDIVTVSDTIVPMMFQSAWNKDLTAFIGSMFEGDSDSVSTVYASLVAQTSPAVAVTAEASSSPTSPISSTAPFQLKGEGLPNTIVSYAVSPKKDKVFMFSVESGRGVGYVAPFNGGTAVEIFDTPLTQVNVDWPTENIIAITTKGEASEPGYLYFVNPTTGVWKKIVGPLPGLSAKVSHDGKYVIVSVSGSQQNVLTTLYNVAQGSGTDAIIRTLADKCVWGNFYLDTVYCAVPTQAIAATYPDDWYTGAISTIDGIWQVDATTGNVHLISSIVDQSDRVIDAFNLGLDAKDNYLFFMNKNDLSLWSLDLVSSQ